MKKWDWVIIIILIVISLMPLGIILKNENFQGDYYVLISVNGEDYEKMKLNKENDEVIRIENGNYVNEICVNGREVYMKETNCPDRVCSRQGKISKVGESIVCLPNKLFIEIKGERESEYILSY